MHCRFLEGTGFAASNSAISGIIVANYPDSSASVIGWTRLFYGGGSTIGPIVGSVLYANGGFSLPFYTLGAVAFAAAVLTLFTLPKQKAMNEEELQNQSEEGFMQKDCESLSSAKDLTLSALFQVKLKLMPLIALYYHCCVISQNKNLWLPYLDAFFTFFGDGMAHAMMEPHLKAHNSSQTQVAIVFVILGATFSVSNLLAGYVSKCLFNFTECSCLDYRQSELKDNHHHVWPRLHLHRPSIHRSSAFDKFATLI